MKGKCWTMASLKSDKPQTFDGKRDRYTVRTWVYQVKLRRANPDLLRRYMLSGIAAAWWYTRVGSNTVPTTSTEFEAAVYQEFVPFDSVQM